MHLRVLTRALCVGAALGLSACQTPDTQSSNALAVSDDDYLSVIERTAVRMDTDIERAHDCWVTSVIQVEGDPDPVLRELYRYQADAFVFRIRDALDEGAEVPVEYDWVEDAIIANGGSAYGAFEDSDWAADTARLEGLKRSCPREFELAAAEDFDPLMAAVTSSFAAKMDGGN